MTHNVGPVLQVAVAVPLRKVFDYLPPSDCPIETIQPGVRVRVMFGRSRKVGVVIGVNDSSDVPAAKLKPALAVLDRHACLDEEQLKLLRWAADY